MTEARRDLTRRPSYRSKTGTGIPIVDGMDGCFPVGDPRFEVGAGQGGMASGASGGAAQPPCRERRLGAPRQTRGARSLDANGLLVWLEGRASSSKLIVHVASRNRWISACRSVTRCMSGVAGMLSHSARLDGRFGTVQDRVEQSGEPGIEILPAQREQVLAA